MMLRPSFWVGYPGTPASGSLIIPSVPCSRCYRRPSVSGRRAGRPRLIRGLPRIGLPNARYLVFLPTRLLGPSDAVPPLAAKGWEKAIDNRCEGHPRSRDSREESTQWTMSRAVAARFLTSAGMTASNAFDVIVVGAGHNAMIAASYLAREGRSVCLLDQNPTPGGWV